MEVRPENLTAQTDRKEDSRQLRRRLTGAGVALLVAFFAVVSATYAWYIYNTGRHTTKVRMAAGAGANLQISNSYDGTYGSAAILDSFEGLTPVSTNRISGGFQKVTKFIVRKKPGSGSGLLPYESVSENERICDRYLPVKHRI